MTAQIIDTPDSSQKTKRIRAQVSTVLTKWGLLPRFKRWRLTQDADTGMVILFGILNNKYIATHTTIPFSNYFDPRLLHDLANELQLQVVSCSSDGLRYAFVLDRGSLGKLPSHIDFPSVDKDSDKFLVRVVYNEKTQAVPTDATAVDDRKLVDEGVGAFLKVFDDIKLRDDASAQKQPDIVVINEDEFNKRVEEHEANRQRIKHIKSLFDEMG